MGNQIAIERKPIPLANVLRGDVMTNRQLRAGEDSNGGGGGGGSEANRYGVGAKGLRSYNSSLHAWRFFADAEDSQVVHNEAVCLSEPFSFDRHQVYLALHVYSENDAAGGVKIADNGDEREPSDQMNLGGRNSRFSTRATIESLLASSVEAFTPRGLASCLDEAFITSTSADDNEGGSSSSAASSSTSTGDDDNGEGGDAVTGNSTTEEDGEPLAYSMYVWRGKDSSRYPQALALTKSFELEKALKKDGKKPLRLLFRGGDKVPLSSVYSYNNHLLRVPSDSSTASPPGESRTDEDGSADHRRRAHNSDDHDDEDSDDGHDGGSDEDEERPYSRQNHLYHQLLKRRRITRRSAAGGEAGEGPCRTDSGSNGSVPKLSLPRIKNLFQSTPLSNSLQSRSLSAGSLGAIIAAASQERDSSLPTSAVNASSAPEAERSPMVDGGASFSLSSSSSPSPASTAEPKNIKSVPRITKSSSATIPSPSTAPPSPKKIKGKFKLPPINTERMSKSGPIQAIPISGFSLSNLQALQEKEDHESDTFNRAEVSLRSEKLKKYDSICSKITDQLYLGSQTVSRDVDMLKQQGVTHILNCAGSICPEYHPDQFIYRTLYLMDGVREDITCMLYDIIEWMENVISSNGKILVHCQQGVSRSSAMMIGYLMWKRGWDFERTHMFVKERRGVSSPNAGFICQLLYLAKRLSLARGGVDLETRLYQVVTHTRHDPDFIVAKLAKKETLTELQDSSAPSPSCYILQSPQEFFIWIGAQCSERFIEVAQRTVRRVQRFENATQTVYTVEQGKETEEFKRCLKQVNLEEVT